MAKIVSEVLIERLADWGVDTMFGLPGDGINGMAGAGALHAREEVLAAADKLGAPVIKTLPGKAEDCDTLFMIGTNFPYTQHLPAPGKVRVVQIDADPTRAGVRMPTEVPVVGDARESLQALLPLLTRKTDRSHLNKYTKAMARWRSDMDALESPKRSPIAPQNPVSVLDDLAADDAVLTCDSGTIATWAARHRTIRGSRQLYLSGNLATMAPGLPYAIGIQYAFPGRQVIAYVGDGGFVMLMAEFLTAVRAGLPIKVIVNNNNSLGQILWEQMVLGYPEHGVRFPAPAADFAAWATACGGYGAKVDNPKKVEGAIKNALAFSGPALVDIDVDPNEPPLPGKVAYDQAKKFAQAFLKGQPHKAAIGATLFKDKIEQLGR